MGTDLRATGRHLPYGITQVNTPRRNPSQPSRYSIYLPRRVEGWVDLCSLIAAQMGIEPTTAWLQARCPNRYATQPPSVMSCQTDSHTYDASFYFDIRALLSECLAGKNNEPIMMTSLMHSESRNLMAVCWGFAKLMGDAVNWMKSTATREPMRLSEHAPLLTLYIWDVFVGYIVAASVVDNVLHCLILFFVFRSPNVRTWYRAELSRCTSATTATAWYVCLRDFLHQKCDNSKN